MALTASLSVVHLYSIKAKLISSNGENSWKIMKSECPEHNYACKHRISQFISKFQENSL